jgi:hypothetical protein
MLLPPPEISYPRRFGIACLICLRRLVCRESGGTSREFVRR